MVNDLAAEEVRALMKREPDATRGFVRVTFISEKRIAPGRLPLPFADGRPAGSALYFMSHAAWQQSIRSCARFADSGCRAIWGAQAASLQLPAALPATSLDAQFRYDAVSRSRQAAETCRLAVYAPQKRGLNAA